MNSLVYIYILILLILGNSFCNSAKILGIFPLPAMSHFTYNNAVMRSLSNAGHEVTMISPFAKLTKLENYSRIIDSSKNTPTLIGQSSFEELRNASAQKVTSSTFHLEKPLCNSVFRSKEYQDLLNSNERFDVIFTQIIYLYKCYLPIAKKLGVPVIGVATHKSWYFGDRAISNIHHTADVPFTFISSWKGNRFYERLLNVWSYASLEYFWFAEIVPSLEQFQRENEELLRPYSGYMDIEPTLIFFNGHPAILPRAMNPNAIDIGGIQVPPPNPLPEDIQNFINEAQNGVILFTFGSMVKANTLPSHLTTMFMDVFAALPQRVIWKFEEKVNNVPNNVMLLKWLPQRDILEHHNVKAFISHCGQAGVYEAIYTATPIIACPLMYDQPSNADILENLGVAVQLNIDTLSTEGIRMAINSVFNNTKYRDNMQKLSKAFKNRAITPQQSVVYWTEYIITNGAFNLKTASSQLNWFQYFLLDILCVIVLVFACIVYFLFWCFKFTKIMYKIIFKFQSVSNKEKVN